MQFRTQAKRSVDSLFSATFSFTCKNACSGSPRGFLMAIASFHIGVSRQDSHEKLLVPGGADST
jgi:hypothetical protein